MKKKNKKQEYKENEYLKIMRSQKFYNEKRIPGYNHLLGTVEGKPVPSKYDMPQPTIGTLK